MVMILLVLFNMVVLVLDLMLCYVVLESMLLMFLELMSMAYAPVKVTASTMAFSLGKSAVIVHLDNCGIVVVGGIPLMQLSVCMHIIGNRFPL